MKLRIWGRRFPKGTWELVCGVNRDNVNAILDVWRHSPGAYDAFVVAERTPEYTNELPDNAVRIL